MLFCWLRRSTTSRSPQKADRPGILLSMLFLRQKLFSRSPQNQTVSNPIKAAEDTLQIIRPQTGSSECGGGRGGGRGLPGKRLETTKGRWRSFLHVGVHECVESIRGRKKKGGTQQAVGGRRRGRAGEPKMLKHVRGSPYTAVWRPRSSS